MADCALGLLLQTIGSLLQQEASLLQGFHIDLDEIKLELQSMQTFLKDADRKKNSNEGVKTWVGQIREVAYEVEGIIDKFMYHIANQHRGPLSNVILLPKRYYYKRQIAIELQAIKSKIHTISERRNQFGFMVESLISKTKDNSENWQHLGEYSSFIPDIGIVGIDNNKSLLIKQLTNERPQRLVLSVVGMGGLGKTTLVTKAYNSPQVKKHFNCHAWITVSQSYTIDELLTSMIKELYKSNKEDAPLGIGEMKSRDLMEIIIKYLQAKRYIIVLDDVWKETIWEHMQVALPENGCGSRVLLTTRIGNVSSSFGVENPLHLKPLDEDSAWTLFCNKAFSDKRCPPHLEPYAKRLLQKCEGLPLAIVTIGGLMLMQEKSCLEWKKIENSLSWQLSNNTKLGWMKNILLLSFNDLPYHLKHCFLYCSIFPKDCEIRRKRLIRLWIAEGFVEERRGLTLEEVAEEYIKELICRSLLQVVDDHLAMQKSIRIHDILRELALSIIDEENFCIVHDGKEEIQINEGRRLSVHNGVVNIRSRTCHFRSMILLKTELPTFPFYSNASSIRFLRVLDLQASQIESVPDVLVELFNLRYLSLRNTNVKELPNSIGRLWNLQTLDIRDSKINKLPRGVEKLKKLRHLFTYRYDRSQGFDFYNFAESSVGICNLKFLQTLDCIGANSDIVKRVGNLTQLRHLSITRVKQCHGVELCASLQKMEFLLKLEVKAITEEELLDLETLSTPPTHLKILMLCGRLERLPYWIHNLLGLTEVIILWSQSNEDPLSALYGLPNLVHLHLQMAFVGQEMCIRRGGFLKLEQLFLSRLPHLNRIKIEEDSMSCIQGLSLINCSKLKNIPEGIEYLSSLQFLYLKDMSEELLEKIRGVDGAKLRRIPKISHFNSKETTYEYLS